MAWSEPTSGWKYYDPAFEFDALAPDNTLGPWVGHRWFVYDLLRWRQPDVVVCVAPGFGASLFAFAQAVKDGDLSTSIVAVDPWPFDPTCDVDTSDAKEVVVRIRSLAFDGQRLELRRRETSAAADDFADASIDLIHIEDLPGTGDVRSHVEKWLPKLRDGGLLAVHDLNGTQRVGAARYCEDLVDQYGGLVFPHSFGLAVVTAKGSLGWSELVEPSAADRACAYYPTRAQAHLYGVQLEDHIRMVAERDGLLRDQEAIIADRDQSIAYLNERRTDQDAVIRASQVALGDATDPIQVMQLQQLSSVIANQSAQLTVLDSRIIDLKLRNKKARRRLLAAKGRQSPPLKVLLKGAPRKAAKKARSLSRKSRAAVGRPGSASKSQRTAALSSVSRAPQAASTLIPDFQLEKLRRGFDADFYSSHLESSVGSDAWAHYLAHGMAVGAPISAAAAAGVRQTTASPTGARELEAAPSAQGLLYSTDGSVDVIPLPCDDLTAYRPFVTFDLWDTLIERTRPADSGKLSTARRMKRRFPMSRGLASRSEWDLMGERVALEAEIARSRPSEEYRANEVLGLLLARYCPDADATAEADSLVDAEVMEEIAYSRPRSEFVGPPPANAVILSDFYFGAEDLKRIVRGVCPDWADVPLISSCDLDVSKRLNGELFKVIREERAIPAEMHLHVGDNLHSDVNMQVKTGGSALHLAARSTLYPGPGSLRPAFAAELFEHWPAYVASQLDAPSTAAQASGRRWSFLPASLVMGASEAAMASQARSVFYLSREGIFLQRVHRAMAEGDSTYQQIEAAHLAVSRRSTFGPSLRSLSTEELMRLWSMYGSQSIRGLLLSIGVEDELPSGLLRGHGLRVDESVSDISNDARVRGLLADATFVEFVWQRLQDQRALLAQYLRRSFAREAGEIVVSDVGWRGTIQDNIDRVIARPTRGVYLGLFPFLNPQSPTARKQAVAFDGNRGNRFGYLSPPAAIERPWTPHQGSTIRYVRTEDGRDVLPVLETSESHATAAIDEFQAGVVEAAPVFAHWLNGLGIMASSLGPGLRAQLRDYFRNPDPVVADIWFDSDHDDTFGAVGHSHIYAKPRPEPSWFDTAGAAELAYKSSGWPAGFAAWTPVRTLTTTLEQK